MRDFDPFLKKIDDRRTTLATIWKALKFSSSHLISPILAQPRYVCGWNYQNWKLGNILPRVKSSHAKPHDSCQAKTRRFALRQQSTLRVRMFVMHTGNATPLHSAYQGPVWYSDFLTIQLVCFSIRLLVQKYTFNQNHNLKILL